LSIFVSYSKVDDSVIGFPYKKKFAELPSARGVVVELLLIAQT